MDISRTSMSNQIAGKSNEAAVERGPKTRTETDERDQAMRNAVNQLQARYGEKPKEGRQIKKTLDKDDFMRIMITEMKHQDPTKPMDADKMASQMAQLTSVEQLKNMGSAIEKLADKNSASDRLAMSAMIGKQVTVDKGRFVHQKNELSSVNFDLPENAEKVKLTIMNDRGEEVVVRELEPMKAGPNSYNWDGMNASGIPSNTGNYIIRIDAENQEGKKIAINPISSETIMGVSFEGGETNFLVGDSKTPQKVAFKNVIRIEGDGALRSSAATRKSEQMGSIKEKAAQAGNQEFALPPELREKFKDQLGAESQVAQAAAEDEAPVQAEGFANGLKD